jgi:hypothetical protein
MNEFGFRRVRVFVSLFVIVFTVFVLNFSEWWTEQSILGTANVSSTIKKVATAIQGTIGQSEKQYKPKSKSKYAIFTLLAGIDPYNSLPLGRTISPYLGYLLHMAAVRYMLDETGSTMDFNILMRFKYGLNATLPESQSIFFKKLRMNIEYLPQQEDDSWRSFMMEKFQILRYHEYSKILFVDADVLPLCNWDHYFNMSEEGVISPNFVFAYNMEPAQGGFFLLSPEPGDWEKYLSITGFINSTIGFGFPLAQPAESLLSNYTEWDWHGASDDQGMLYHWVRYVKKNVTLIKKDRLRKWVELDGEVQMVEEVHNFDEACPNRTGFMKKMEIFGYPIIRDFIHFTGSLKPWKGIDWTYVTIKEDFVDKTKYQLWAVALRKAWRKYDLGSVRQLIPNISDLLEQDIVLVEAFLNQSTSNESSI